MKRREKKQEGRPAVTLSGFRKTLEQGPPQYAVKVDMVELLNDNQFAYALLTVADGGQIVVVVPKQNLVLIGEGK